MMTSITFDAIYIESTTYFKYIDMQFLYSWKSKSSNELISKHTPAVFIPSEKGLRVAEETVFAEMISTDDFLQLKDVGVWTLTLSMQLSWVATK